MPAFIPIKTFLELIKEDSILQPTTKVILESLKKAHQNYVPLPLEHDIILCSQKSLTLHKDMKPLVKVWTREDWTENNRKEFTRDKTTFLAKILNTYEKMGYTYVVHETDLLEVDKILEELESLMTKARKRLGRLGL